MALDELTQTRLIVLAVLAAIALWFAWGRWRERQRFARFARLAAALDGTVTREDEYRWAFSPTVGERRFEVRHRLVGPDASGSGARGWCVISELPLAGVSDLHAVDIRERLGKRRADFEKRFAIVDAGMPLRDGWATERVRRALADFFDGELGDGTLSIEAGRLVYRNGTALARHDAARLRDQLSRQATLASALERAI